MTRFVLDCSVAMAWCFEDEADDYSDAVMDRLANGTGLVPSLWPLEVANVLLVAERRRRLSEADSTRFLEILAQLPIVVADAHGLDRIAALLELGRAQSLWAYDAAYLDLAMREAVPLATRDRRLREVARKKGVGLFALR